MIYVKTLVLSTAILAASILTASAETFTSGVIKKINAEAGKVTIIHEELVDLGMPSMTMVFRVAEPEMLDAMSEGQEIEFLADRIEGKLTVTEFH